MEIFQITLRMYSLLQSPFCLKSTYEIDPEMACPAFGTVRPLNCRASSTLTCYLFLQSGNDNMKENPVINQDTIVCSVKGEIITGIMTLGL